MRRHRGVLALLLLAVAGVVSGQSPWSLDAGGGVFLPVRDQAAGPGTPTYRLYRTGFAGTVGGTYDKEGILHSRAALRYASLPTAAGESLSLISLQGGGGLDVSITDSIEAHATLLSGAFAGVFSSRTIYMPVVSARAGISARLTPSITLSLSGGYEYYVDLINFERYENPESNITGALVQPLAEGIGVNLAAVVTLGAPNAGPRTPRIEIEPPRFDRVFPVFYRYYDENPLGSVRIRNGERERISNVRVSVLVNRYMDAPKESVTIDSMEPGEVADVPLRALFTDSILDVTEGTSVAAEVIVEYDVADERLAARRSQTIDVVNRNNMTWDDDRRAAAFVTANDPTVNRFARNITAAVRSTGSTAVNERIRLAMAIFDALRLYGMEYAVDPDSSYIELSENESVLDYLQFPQQSLDFRSGDCDDLSILYSALLESLGIPTAFITIPGHLYSAFALGISENEARSTFANPDDLVFVDGQAWMPVETTLVREDFMQAWATGAKQWRENALRGAANLVAMRPAWSEYAPTAFASQPLDIAIPSADEIVPEYTALLERYVRRQIEPQVTDLRERIDASGGNPRLTNRLGALYARFGLYGQAQEVFESIIAEREYRPALVNLGNLAYLSDDLEEAQAYYDRARAERADDPLVLISLARVAFDRAEYTVAEERYREAEILDPELAGEFAYIVSESGDAGRASSAQERDTMIWEEE